MIGRLQQHIKSNKNTRKKLSALFTRENVLNFLLAFVIALVIWLLVNLGRNFHLTLNVPVQMQTISEELSIASRVPKTVNMTLYGEGWSLINIYNNPPTMTLNPPTDEVGRFDVNALELLRDQVVATSGMEVIRVQPQNIPVLVERKVTKKVPVRVISELKFRSLHDFVGEPRIIPDSVEVTGAESRIKQITEWFTRPLVMEDVKEPIDAFPELEAPDDFITLNRANVRYRANVSEYTEGELRTAIRTQGLPRGDSVIYTPAVITIKYDVPISEYAAAQDIIPFIAYVPYREILRDTTGSVNPTIAAQTTSLNLRLRSYQPRKVGYYKVVKK